MSKKTSITEKNVPTNPSLWQKFVSQAKRKFDVYPSAYANGWASKQYKAAGGKWKTESVEDPQHVAAGLPQTKELKGKKIGERFLEYLQDNGLKHAAYQNEAGSVKVIGLNKDQVKEAIKNCVEGYLKKKVKEVGLPGGAGVGLSLPNGYINGAPSSDDVKKMRDNLKEADDEGEGESKKFPGHYHLGGGYYATSKDGEAVKKSDKGTLRTLTPQEKKAKAAEKKVNKPQPATQQPQAQTKPAKAGATAAKTTTKPDAPKPQQPAEKPEQPTKPQTQTAPKPQKPDTSKMSPEDKKATEEYESEKEGLDQEEKAVYDFLDGIPTEEKSATIQKALDDRSWWQKFSQDTIVGSWMKKKGKQLAQTGDAIKSLFSGRKPPKFGVVKDCSKSVKENEENIFEGPKDRQDYLASLGKDGKPKTEEPKKDTTGCKPVHYEDFMKKDDNGEPIYKEEEVPVYKTGKLPKVEQEVSYSGKFNRSEIDPDTGFYTRDGKYYSYDEKEVDKDGNILGKDGKPQQKTSLLGNPITKIEKTPVYRDDLTPEESELANESFHSSHEQQHALTHTALEASFIIGGALAGGTIAAAGKAVLGIKGATVAGGAAKHGIMHTVQHVATHILKDTAKHAAAEIMGVKEPTAAGGAGAAATFATGGILESNSIQKQLLLISENKGSDDEKNSQFFQDLIKKTMERMKTFEMTPQQKLQSIKDYKKKKAEGKFTKKVSTSMNEGINKDRIKEIGNFVEFVTKRLKLNERPKIKLVKEADYIAKAIGEDGASALGSFVPDENKIMVVNDGRLLADVLRTIAHEMVHRKQQEMGKLEDIDAAGKTGSQIENQANSIAGILLREYGKKNKTIYEIRLNESVYNQIEKEVSELYTETKSLREYIQKQIN